MSRLARRIGTLISVLGLTTATVLVAGPAHAGTAPSNCTTIKQLGSTVYITDFWGATAASVKQFYGTCNGYQRNWSYVWLWDQALAKYDIYVTQTEIWAQTSSGGWQEGLGQRPGGWNQQEVKSGPTNTAYQCTRAYAVIDLFDKASGYDLGTRRGLTETAC
jgi:hypothetical protein